MPQTVDRPAASQQRPYESSGTAPTEPGAKDPEVRIVKHLCVACLEQPSPFQRVRVPCQHFYCWDCIYELVLASLRGGGIFPARCCGRPVMSANVRAMLSSNTVEQYDLKALETRTQDRTNCHVKSCLAFIPLNAINGKTDIATCPLCRNSTCTTCKGPTHEGVCPQDTGKQQVLEAAKKAGWQRCFSCGQVVERQIGCIHMTCTCGAQFCYLCGKEWRSCGCHESGKLSANAAAATNSSEMPDYHQDIETGGEAAAEMAALEREARLATRLAEGAEVRREVHRSCTEAQWEFAGRRIHCQVCLEWMPLFTYECSTCRISVCRTCTKRDSVDTERGGQLVQVDGEATSVKENIID